MQDQMTARLQTWLSEARLLPVITVNSVEHALELTEALQASGSTAIELTLRTEAALSALSVVKERFPDLVVAAGTVNTPEMMLAVSEAGADFAVSPGMTEAMIDASQSLNLPYLPGVATPSEVLAAGERGLRILKLFPAVPIGGLALLKSIAAPLADYQFCPTGGLNKDNYEEYLSLHNVICVGGSWMVGN